MYGYAGTVAIINLSTQRVDDLSTSDYAERFIGGKGIAAKLFWDLVNPDIDALDAENCLIFMTGPFAGILGVAGSRWGGLLSYYIGEADAITPTKPKFRQIELTLKKLAVLTYVTDELVTDVPALNDFLRTTVEGEYAFRIQDALIRGTGTGAPLGIINSGALISVAAEAGQGDTIVWENITKMWSRFLMTDKNSSCWLINKDVLPQLMSMNIGIGTAGTALWIPGNSAASEPYQSLFGLPVIQCESCSSLSNLGDIILCDLSQVVCIERGSMREDFSIHVAFSTDQGCFRWIYRYDLQPELAAPITAAQGSNTLSPFVSLAAR